MSVVIGLQQRLPEVGRLRLGERSEKGYPKAVSNWRMTSSHRDLLELAAEQFGGTVELWGDGQYELYTETTSLPVRLPRVAEPYTQWYELWSGGGCKRRCNGEELFPSKDACLCSPENRECKLTTRVNFLMPTIPSFGMWRMESHGLAAAQEITAVVDYAMHLVREGHQLDGRLTIEKRSSGSKNWVVPVLTFDMKDFNTLTLPAPKPPVLMAPPDPQKVLEAVVEQVEETIHPQAHELANQIIEKEEFDQLVELAKTNGMSREAFQELLTNVAGRTTSKLTYVQYWAAWEIVENR